MTVATRTTALEADPWATDAPPMAPTEQAPTEGPWPAGTYAGLTAAEATDLTDDAVSRISDAMATLDGYVAGWADGHLDHLDYGPPAELIAWLQATKARLGVIESYLARELGRTEGCPDLIVLPDGRHAEVVKGKDRKAWDHDAWKHDVRAKLLEGLADYTLVDADGAPYEATEILSALVADAQAVHGSTAPKVKSLRELGLAADDYCESYPGPYTVKVSTPADSTPTTAKD